MEMKSFGELDSSNFSKEESGDNITNESIDNNEKDPITKEQLKLFLKNNAKTVLVEPDLEYLEKARGISNRIKMVLIEHMGSTLPVIHFTNAGAGDSLDDLVSTGFLERFIKEGTKGKLHVGAFRKQDKERGNFRDMDLETDSLLDILGVAKKVASQFYHHGKRTNKNQLKDKRGGEYSLPAVILLPKLGKLDRGTDEYYHWIVPTKINSDELLSIMLLDPEKASRFQKIDNDKQKEIVREILHQIGLRRLYELTSAFNSAESDSEREDIVIYAYDLVIGFLISESEHQEGFQDAELSERALNILNDRKRKYSLLRK